MQSIYPPSMTKPKGHYAPAIVHQGFVFVSGQLATDDAGNPIPGTIEEETLQCLKRIETILKSANSAVNQIVKLNVFVSAIGDWPKVNDVIARFFGEHRPARIVIPSGPLNYGCKIEIDCIAGVIS